MSLNPFSPHMDAGTIFVSLVLGTFSDDPASGTHIVLRTGTG